MKRAKMLAILLLSLLVLLPANFVLATSFYWDIDPNFAYATSHPYYSHQYQSYAASCPWGTNSWGVQAQAIDSPGSGVSEYLFNVSNGLAHAWLRQDGYLWVPGGSVDFVEPIPSTSECTPPSMLQSILNQEVLLSYNLMRDPTDVWINPLSSDFADIGFGVTLYGTYQLNNGTYFTRGVWIDFYLLNECGQYGTNDSKCWGGMTTTHPVMATKDPAHTYTFWWKIRDNFNANTWITESYDLRSIIETSFRISRCYDNTRSDTCMNQATYQTYNLPDTLTLQVSTIYTEAHGSASGFTLTYLNLIIQTPLSCSASANPTSGRWHVTVQFSASCSSGTPPYNYTWSFNDGSGKTSILQNPPPYTYYYDPNPGRVSTYYPTLTVIDSSLSRQVVTPNVPSISVTCGNPCPTSPTP